MAKKKAAKKPNASDMIHFRPGQELGALLGQFSDQSMISRGEAAKRLASLAIHGLDIGFYPDVEELSGYLYGSSNFDEATHAVYVSLYEDATEKGVEVVDLPRDRKFEVVREHLHRYQLMRGFEEEAQKQKVQIKLYRTTE